MNTKGFLNNLYLKLALTVILFVFTVILDYLAEGKLLFTYFFMLIIIFATRYINVKLAVIIAVLAIVSTTYIDYALKIPEFGTKSHLFNSVTRILVYFIVIFLTNKVRTKESNLENTISERTKNLENEISERKEKEKLLIESELKYKNLLNNEPIAFLRMNLETNTVDFTNTEFTKQSGYTISEYNNLTDEESNNMIHPEDREKVYRFYRNWSKNNFKEKGKISYRIINRWGKIIWLDTYLFVDRNSEGVAKFVDQICVDISDQKLAEESLLKSSERYKSFIENSNEGIYRVEFEVPADISAGTDSIIKSYFEHGFIAECNDKFAQMFGYQDASEIIGIETKDLYSDQENIMNLKMMKNFISNNFQMSNQISERIDKSGNTIFVRNNAVGIIKDKKLVRIWGTQINVTELKKTQDQNRVLSLALEQSPNAVVIMDTKFRIQYVNPKFKDITGFTDEEVKDKIPFILLDEEIKNTTRDIVVDTLKKDRIWAGESYNKTKNNKYYWEYAIITPIKNENNELTNYLYIKQDISDRKKYETEIIEAKTKAEIANKIKNEFIANMSHEIRTPMNGIIGMLQLLEMTKLDEEQKDNIETIKYSSDLLLRIVNDILDFTKLEVGGITIRNEPLSIKEFGNNISNMFTLVAKNKNIKFDVNFNSNFDYKILGDLYRLNQIVINLVGNAFKFTQKGSVSVNINEYILSDKLVEIEFKVIDTGIGIPEGKFDLLFESFTQLENTFTKKYSGTGLGLSIVKKLVDLMNGKISLKSEINKGSEFSVKIEFEILN